MDYTYRGPLFSLRYHGVGHDAVPTVCVAVGGLDCEALSDHLVDLGTPLGRWEEYLGDPWVYIEEAERLVQAMRSLRIHRGHRSCGARSSRDAVRVRGHLARRLRDEHGLSAREIAERVGVSHATVCKDFKTF